MTVFVKISNQQIYNQMNSFMDSNRLEHDEIKGLIVGYKNQVARLKWSLGGITTLSLLTLGYLFSHINVGR